MGILARLLQHPEKCHRSRNKGPCHLNGESKNSQVYPRPQVYPKKKERKERERGRKEEEKEKKRRNFADLPSPGPMGHHKNNFPTLMFVLPM